MKRFIEVTIKDDGCKVLCPIEQILSVLQRNDGTAFIETYFNKKVSSGIYTAESYDEIKDKINKAEV